MTEPLPCPFCGHVGVTHNEGSTFRWLTTMCITCGAQCGEERIDTLSKDQGAAIEQAKEAAIKTWNTRAALEQQAEPVSMRMPKVGDKVICLEDESLGEVVSLTGGGSPDIVFDDGSRGTYMLREFAELFGYAEQRQQQAEPVQERITRIAWDERGVRTVNGIPDDASQRQWQGLTDEDFLEACQLAERGNYLVAFQRIQTKLKGKNT